MTTFRPTRWLKTVGARRAIVRKSSLRDIVQWTLLAAGAGLSSQAGAAELPMACIAGSCGVNGPQSWVGSGSASATVVGNTLTVNQVSDRAVLNWASFNVSADGRVVFQQPKSSSIALNRIFQDSPSRIFGRVDANGEIYLVNPNGVIFGRTAVINASGILASTLDISPETFDVGIASSTVLSSSNPAALNVDAAHAPGYVVDADGVPIRGSVDRDGNIIKDPAGQPIKVQLMVQEGAKLSTNAANGRILLASQVVDNAGKIAAADGQVILAAGQKVFLQADADPQLRGLLVEVDGGGAVFNRPTGDVSTVRGNTTLVGLAVNQQGRISASTSVAANGSIRLLARDTVTIENSGTELRANRTGTLDIGKDSSTAVLPEVDDLLNTAADEQEQYRSSIEAMGQRVIIRSNAQLLAPGGNINVSALVDPNIPAPGNGIVGRDDPSAQLHVESGAVLDVSGSDATLQMARNLVSVELRASELADSPNQRDSAIRGQAVTVDARIGTPLGDVTGALAAVPKNVAERTSAGGTISLISDGGIAIAAGSTFDVSGGLIHYAGGVVQTSQLIGADGKLYDIGTADPSRTYVAVINPTYRRTDDRWGQVDRYVATGLGYFEPGYDSGADAGTLQFAGRSMILNGTFVGNATAGPYQRSDVPLGGRLLIGLDQPLGSSPVLDYRAPSIELATHAPVVAVGPDGSLPSGITLQLPTDYLRNGFTRTALYSNGEVLLPADSPLRLTPGSSFIAQGQHIDVRSDIANHGGSIALTAHDTSATAPAREGIVVQDGVVLDVSGEWTNDALLDQVIRPVDALRYNGGSINLSLVSSGSVPQELILGDNVRLIADGGAQVRRDGSIVAGRGGSIGLSSGGYLASMEVGENVGLSAFGVLGATGGKFALEVAKVSIGNGSQWAAAQSYDGNPADDSSPAGDSATTGTDTEASPDAYFQVGTALFTDYGFASFSLSASSARTEDQPDVFYVLPDTQLTAVVKSNIIDQSALLSRQTGGTVAGFSSVMTPEPIERSAASIAFATGISTAQPAPANDEAGDLRIGRGARLQADPRSQFSFTSLGNLFIDGSVVTHGGTVTAGVVAPPTSAADKDKGYLPDQRMQVGSTAVIDVSGATLYRPNDLGLLVGDAIGAGAINLVSSRGSIVAEAGSLLDMSGTASTFDVATGVKEQPYQRQVIGGAGGSLTVRAPESIGLYGAVDGHADRGETGNPAGGSLTVQLTRNVGFNAPAAVAGTFPSSPRTIELTLHDSPANAPIGSGNARFSQDFVARSGIDSLTLQADGRIDIAGGTHLSLARQITLDTQQLSMVGGGIADLQAAYVSIGNSLPADSAATSAAGAGRLNVQADFIELFGSSVMSSVAKASLQSDGDIRLRGSVRENGSALGGLTINGDLSLAAARVYGATTTQFALRADSDRPAGVDGPYRGGRVEFSQTEASPGNPLSAGASISVIARQIDQAGTLLAPFGSISLQGSDSVVLEANSITSVSGKGSIVPYGQVAVGEWQYAAAGRIDTATPVTALPERSIAISGDITTIAAGAVVDIRGGGDLYAYEWTPGTGGTKDALAAGVTPGLYAVLPTLKDQTAPYDPQEFANSDLHPGDSIYLSGHGDLAAGVYALLPARYALLPGAYLVSAVAGEADIQPGAATSLKDGTPVVAGYRTFGATGLGSGVYSGFALRPGTYGRALAAYTDYNASSFFPAAAARADSTARVNVPADAGSLSLFAGSSLGALGSVLTAPATGGAGASIDISAQRLAVIGVDGVPVAGEVQIGAAQLSSWNPSRLLLGGTHVRGQDDTIDVTADTVRIETGVTLALDEVILAAHDRIGVDAGSTLASRSASGSTPRLADDSTTLHIATGDAGSAVLAVSDLSRILVDRTQAATRSATIAIDDGSVIASRGAVTIDSQGGSSIDGRLDIAGARIAIGSDRIVFGAASVDTTTVIDAALEAQLAQAGALRLFGGTAIDMARDVTLDLSGVGGSEIELHTPQLLASGTNASVRLAADRIVLGSDVVASSSGVPTAGSGSLSLQANSIELGAGVVDIGGFAHSEWIAHREVLGTGAGHYGLGGDLTVTTPIVAIANRADTDIALTDGSIRLQSSVVSGAASPTQLGGSLSLLADNIDNATRIAAASGLVTLQARQDLHLLAGSAIDVAGATVVAGGREMGSQGGTVRLLAGRDLSAAAGSMLDMSGAVDSSAGRLIVDASHTVAFDSTLAARAAAGSLGGSFDLHAGQLHNTSALLASLQSGGFTQAQRLHVDAGDIVVGAGSEVRAKDIELVTGGGRVQVDGTISAIETDQRGTLRLFGQQGVSLSSGAALHADANAVGRRGGDIDIGTSQGSIDLAAGSTISARGSAIDGTLTLHAPVVGSDVGIGQLASTISAVREVAIAPKFSADLLSGFATAADFTAVLDAARTWFDSFGTAVLARLNPTAAPVVSLRPDIELKYAGGDLNLDLSSTPLELSDAAWRFAGQPASVSVRSSGSLLVSGTISDGFQALGSGSTSRLDLLPGDSASISLIAGADLASVDPLATSRAATANLNFLDGSVVRTGTGSVSLRAANDVIFGTGASVYTGGVAGSPTQRQQISNNGFLYASFPDQGGSIRIDAGGNVIGSQVAQAASIWQFNGVRPANTPPYNRINGINALAFGWNIGALGGGDVRIDARVGVKDLSAATANSTIVAADDSAARYGGGSLSVHAGTDIDSSMFYGAQGSVLLHADGDFGTSHSSDDKPLYTLLQLGDTRALLEARRDIDLERVLNPTVLPTPAIANSRAGLAWTYSEGSSVTLQSAGGDIDPLAGADVNVKNYLGTAVPDILGTSLVYSVFPSSVFMRAFSGDIDVQEARVYVFPSNRGQLDLFAAHDIRGINGGGFVMSDGTASGVPTLLAPTQTAPVALSEVIKSASGARHGLDDRPVLITAGNDIVNLDFNIPKFAQMVAGRDIYNTSLFGQNLRTNDVTLVQAGRDVRFPLTPQRRDLSIGGPGQLDILAGRNVDLGFTSGIATTGRLLNPSIATEQGAAITVMAGLGREPDYAGFLDTIVAPQRQFDAQVIAYVEKLSGEKLSYDQALARLRALGVDRQRPLVDAIFFSELVTSGREANNTPGTGFERGYAAINALFKGSEAGVENAGQSPYRGDLSLAFSRIYTLSGGDISLLVPGGLLNVGLASPPPQVDNRPASELGIVAQRDGSVNIFTDGDVLVNRSRVFTLLGGDIAVWSTRGNIDAGRGAKSSLSAPPPTVTFDATGRVSLDFSGAVAGSGIRTIVTGENVKAGNVDLIAPSGFVDAGDAGIGSAGNLNIAAQQVIGVGNIQVGGSATGVPAETSGLGASLAGVSAVASSSTSASTASIGENSAATEQAPSLADTALSWLEVFVVGLGEDGSDKDKEKKN